MRKNKVTSIIIFTSLVFVLYIFPITTHADSTNQALPDNVKITSNQDGSNTVIVINQKPGFQTNIETSCVNNKCTSTGTSKEITQDDIKNMQTIFSKEQEEMNAFWKMQQQLFDQQQKLFQELWGIQ